MKRTLRATAIILALGLPLSAIAAQFSDIPAGHWATKAVDEATTKGLMAGFPGGTFHGDQAMTRLQLAYVMRKMITQFETVVKGDLKAPTFGHVAITDIGTHIADAPMVLELINAYGIFPGYDLSKGAFQPDKPISRYDYANAVATLYRRAEARGFIRPGKAETITFTDVTPAEKDMVQTVTAQYPVMSGFPDHTFRGERSLNRYEFAASAIKAVPVLQAHLAPKPTPKPTVAPTPMPTPEPTPMPTPTPVPTSGIHANLWELSGTYGMVPNGTIPGVATTPNIVGGQLTAGEEIWDFFLFERLRGFYDISGANAPTVGQFGLGLGYRWKVTENFHIVPSIGADAYGSMTSAFDKINLGIAGGGGLSLEWWLHPAFSISLGAEARYGIPGSGMTLVGAGTAPNIGLLYGGDLKLRWYPVDRFSIQVGGTAWTMPNMTGTQDQTLVVGPNAGIAWQF